jgi:hypothetical protein
MTQIEINFDFRRNYWSKLSQVIGISISTAEIKIPRCNPNRIFALFGEKCFKISTFVSKSCTKIGNRCRNLNSDSETEIEIPISTSKPKSKFCLRHRNRTRMFDFDIEIPTKSVWNSVGISISSKVKNRNRNSDLVIEIEISEHGNIEISTKLG